MEGARYAEQHDLPRIQALLLQALENTPERRGGRLYGHPHRQLPVECRGANYLDDDSRAVIVGFIDDYVVGIGIVGVDDSFPAGPIGVVEELFVEPEARGVGVGESILDGIVEWCRDRRCAGVDIPALPGDRSAKNLCERSGFSARLLIMHRTLT